MDVIKSFKSFNLTFVADIDLGVKKSESLFKSFEYDSIVLVDKDLSNLR